LKQFAVASQQKGMQQEEALLTADVAPRDCAQVYCATSV